MNHLSSVKAGSEQAHLLKFLHACLLFGLPFIVFLLASALLLWRLDMVLAAVTLTASWVFAYFRTRPLILKGRLHVAALTVGYTVLGMASLFVLILPVLYAAHLVLCMMGVVCVLPYARGRALKVYLCAAVVAMVLVVLIGTLTDPVPPLPAVLLAGLLLASISAQGSIICLLLWQYSTRLRQQIEYIHQSEQRFRSLAEATSQAVWLTCPDGNPFVRSPDQQWLTEKIWGAFQGEPLNWLEAIHPEDRSGLLSAWERARARCEPYARELRLLRADGSSTFLLGRSVPVLDDCGQVREWISACTDITEQKAAEDALRFLSHASSLLASSLDFDATLHRVGQLAVPRLSDWCLLDQYDEAGGWKLMALVHTDFGVEATARALLEQQGGAGAPAAQPPAGCEYCAIILHGQDASPGMEPRRVALLQVLGLGSLLQVSLVARGRPSGVLTLGRISRGRPFTEQDAILAEELARRVAVAVDNAWLFQHAQSAIRARDDFVVIASHELRTPLTTLTIKLHTLHRRVREMSLSPEAITRSEEQFTVIGRQVRRLVRLIEEMLDISRLLGGQLRVELETFDLAALVREVVALSQESGELARGKSEVRLTLPEQVIGRWDRLRMEQVITNLLSNALKYGEDRPIDVEVRREAAWAKLVVRDWGMGIAPEDQERVFGRFERAVPVRHFGGLGMGLYIARRVVETMGGAIQLESRPGEGSTFTVLLPLAGPPASQLAMRTSGEGAGLELGGH